MRNVSRAWAYETGLAAGVELGPEIPVNEYYEYFGPDYELDVKSSNAEDMNTPSYLNRVKRIVMENLRHTGGPPSVQMTDIPSLPIDAALDDNEDDELIPPDARRPRRLLDSRRQADGELSDSDDEGEGGRRNHAQHRDRDRTDSPGSRKFGILGSGSTTSLGAGPSGHTTAARVLSTSATRPSEMDVDKPAPPENGIEKVNGVHAKSPDEMVVDTPVVAV